MKKKRVEKWPSEKWMENNNLIIQCNFNNNNENLLNLLLYCLVAHNVQHNARNDEAKR